MNTRLEKGGYNLLTSAAIREKKDTKYDDESFDSAKTHKQVAHQHTEQETSTIVINAARLQHSKFAPRLMS